jgi:hypothetical protein
MSTIGLITLISALMFGVMGSDLDPTWSLGEALALVMLLLGAGLFAASSLQRPSLLWEVSDDLCHRRVRKLHLIERRRNRSSR